MVFHLRNIQNSEITLVPSGSFSIGREEDNFLCIPHGSVSRYHAVIYNTGQDIFLEDNGSSNGTAVRGQLVSERIQVTPGDVIYFGSTPFRLEAPGDDASTAAARADDAASPPKAKLRKATDLVPLEEISQKLKSSGQLPDVTAMPASSQTRPISNKDSNPVPAQPPIETQSTAKRKAVLNTGQIEELGEKLRAGAAPGSRRAQEAPPEDEAKPGEPGARPAAKGSGSYGKSTRDSSPMPSTPSGHRPWMHVYGTTSATPKATTQQMETPHAAPAAPAAPAKSNGPSSMLVIILAVGFGFGLGILVTLLFAGPKIF